MLMENYTIRRHSMMIQVLWHKLKLWKTLTSGVVSVGLLFIATYNIAATPAVQRISQRNPPPEIIGFTLCPSDSLFPGAEIRIQVDVRRNGHHIDYFHWLVETGEGVITDGNGTSRITYQAPNSPGTYQIDVELEYEGTERVRGSATVEVVPEPTRVPTDSVAITINLRSGPSTDYTIIGYLLMGTEVKILGRNNAGNWFFIDSGSQQGWISGIAFQTTPVVMPTLPILTPSPSPTPSPPPTLLSAPTLIAPDDGSESGGTRPDLIWQWEGNVLDSDYYYEVSIWLEDQQDPIDVAWIQYPCYRYDQVPEGKEGQTWEFRWRVAVVKGKPGEKKQWSPVEPCSKWPTVSVWDPGLLTETGRISAISEQRLVKVIVEPPPIPGCPPGGCKETPEPPPRKSPPPR
jgi:hypothetical protein